MQNSLKYSFIILGIISIIFWPINLVLNFVGLGWVSEIMSYVAMFFVVIRNIPHFIKMAKNPKIIAVVLVSFILSSVADILPWDDIAEFIIYKLYNRQLAKERAKIQMRIQEQEAKQQKLEQSQQNYRMRINSQQEGYKRAA